MRWSDSIIVLSPANIIPDGRLTIAKRTPYIEQRLIYDNERPMQGGYAWLPAAAAVLRPPAVRAIENVKRRPTYARVRSVRSASHVSIESLPDAGVLGAVSPGWRTPPAGCIRVPQLVAPRDSSDATFVELNRTEPASHDVIIVMR